MRAKNPLVLWTCCAIAVLAIGFLGNSIEVTHSYTQVCQNTGSIKGYRTNIFGQEIEHWSRPSRLEEFMAQEFPSELTHRWVNSNVASQNLFGKNVMIGDGPFPDVGRISSDQWLTWINKHSKAEIKALYDALAGDRAEANAVIVQILDAPR